MTFKMMKIHLILFKNFLNISFFGSIFSYQYYYFYLIALIINRYTPKIFKTHAKIQILDKKQNNLEMPSAEDLFSNSKINLENEIEIIKSASILNEVIKNLNLNLFVEDVGDVMTSRL